MANANAANENLPEAPHRLVLDSRRKLSMSGVIEVESFDESAIQLTTTRGPVLIRGTGLHLQMLSLDGGQVAVDGTISALSYEEPRQSGWRRLFR